MIGVNSGIVFQNANVTLGSLSLSIGLAGQFRGASCTLVAKRAHCAGIQKCLGRLQSVPLDVKVQCLKLGGRLKSAASPGFYVVVLQRVLEEYPHWPRQYGADSYTQWPKARK